MTDDERNKRFTYHAPTPGQVPIYEDLRRRFAELAGALDAVCPESRELSVAHTQLETAMFWANAAIARHKG